MQTATSRTATAPWISPAMIIIGLAAFIALAADVSCHGKLAQLDRPIQAAIHEFARADHHGGSTHVDPHQVTSFLTRLWALPAGVILSSALSVLGDFRFIAVLTLAVGGWLALRRAWFTLFAWVLALVGSGIINPALKAWFQVPRPQENTFFSLTRGWSFPSGHTMAVAVAAGALTLVLLSQFRFPPSKKTALIAAAILLSLLEGFALMYVGVHYLTDVLGALAISLAWLGVIRLLLARRTE